MQHTEGQVMMIRQAGGRIEIRGWGIVQPTEQLKLVN